MSSLVVLHAVAFIVVLVDIKGMERARIGGQGISESCLFAHWTPLLRITATVSFARHEPTAATGIMIALSVP
jgi:hypothetical protein